MGNHADPQTRESAAPAGETLAMDRDAFLRLGEKALAMAADHIAGRPSQPAHRPVPVDLRREILDQPFPEDGLDPGDVLDRIGRTVMAHTFGNDHPRYFAYVVAAPAPMGILADVLAESANSPGSGEEHAGLYLHYTATRWLKELIGYPLEGSMGLLVAGGSAANLTALAVARHSAAKADGWDVRAQGLQGGRPAMVAYATETAHSCIAKSMELLGIGSDNLRTVAIDDHYRMRLDALRDAVGADRAAGRRPFCVVASAGTVNTGAVDPLDALADFCAAEGLWLHVDGAYGAVGRIDPAVASLYAGMERADSVALDPHKWLAVPIDCGCVLIRDGETQREAFSLVPDYLSGADEVDADSVRWPMEYGFDLTTPLRAVRLWATLAHMGRRGVKRMVCAHNAMARRLATAVGDAPELELMAPAPLSIVCFRYRPEGWAAGDDRLDALNQAIIDALRADGTYYLSPTRLGGRLCLRVCLINYRTTDADIDALPEHITTIGAQTVRRF